MTKNCLSRSISQEPYIILLSFMVQMCKMIICQGVFFSVKILIFQVVKGWKGNKWPEMSKIYVCCTFYCRSHISYDLNLWCTCMYKSFSKFRYSRSLVGEVKGQKMAQNDKKFLSVSLCISGTIHHMIVIFGAHVLNWWCLQQIFSFFKTLIFGCFKGIKDQNDLK